jgi:phenylacetate-CoA ligase
MDAMRVLVEAEPGSAGAEAREAAARMLAKSIKDMVGVSVDAVVGEPGSVARSQGKAVRVVDLRNKA